MFHGGEGDGLRHEGRGEVRVNTHPTVGRGIARHCLAPARAQGTTQRRFGTQHERPAPGPGGREAPAEGRSGAGRALEARPVRVGTSGSGEGDGLRHGGRGRRWIRPFPRPVRAKWRPEPARCAGRPAMGNRPAARCRRQAENLPASVRNYDGILSHTKRRNSFLHRSFSARLRLTPPMGQSKRNQDPAAPLAGRGPPCRQPKEPLSGPVPPA